MFQLIGGVRRNVVALPYSATDIGNANGTFVTPQGTESEFVFPYSGSVVGFGLSLNGTLTTGTLAVAPLVNSALKASFSNALYGSATQVTGTADAGTYPFAAGDKVAFVWQKTGTVAPITRDATLVVLVLLDEVQY